MAQFSPGNEPHTFIGLLDDIRAPGADAPSILQSAGLELASFEQLCWSWLTYCQSRPQLERALAPRIQEALATFSRGDLSIDELVGYTVSLEPRAPVSQALPFRDGSPSEIPSGVVLATPQHAGPGPSRPLSEDQWETLVAAPAAPAAAPPVLPFLHPGAPAPQVDTKLLPLERVAELVAMLIVEPDAAREALKEHHLDEDAIRAQSKEHLQQAGKLSSAGDFSGLETYDRIYVQTLERGRGKLHPDEYGRIVVASERRSLEDVFERLRMPGARFVHIERHWITRMAADGDLFRESMNAIREARRS